MASGKDLAKGRIFILSRNLSLAAIAEECGYETFIKEYRSNQEFLQDLQKFNPHYLVANVETPTFLSDMDMVKQAKELIPGLITIVTGTPFLTYNNNAIYENIFLDYVIIGEPEFTLRDILIGVPDNEILGICYRQNFQAEKNELRPFIENLDLIPFSTGSFNDNPAIINVSRGCPYNCFFCLSTPMAGSKVRMRSAENQSAC